MAKTVSVVVTDDLDGSPNAETVTFGFGGVTYEIDLNKKNRVRLERDFEPYIGAARRVGRAQRRVGSSASTNGRPVARTDRAAVRIWAKQQGLQVSERGRISADVMQQYEAAN